MADTALWTVTMSLRRADGEQGWGREAADFTALLTAQASVTVITPQVYSVSRRGRDGLRVNLSMIAAAADPGQALTVAWMVLRKASAGCMRDWDLASARAEVRGENAG